MEKKVQNQDLFLHRSGESGRNCLLRASCWCKIWQQPCLNEIPKNVGGISAWKELWRRWVLQLGTIYRRGYRRKIVLLKDSWVGNAGNSSTCFDSSHNDTTNLMSSNVLKVLSLDDRLLLFSGLCFPPKKSCSQMTSKLIACPTNFTSLRFRMPRKGSLEDNMLLNLHADE